MHRKLISARDALSLLPQEGAVHTVVSGLGIMGADLPVSAIIEHIQTHEVWLDLESAPLADHFLVIRGRASSRVTSRHFDHGRSSRVFISRSNRPYGLTCSQISGVRAA